MKVEPLLVFSRAYLTPAVSSREGSCDPSGENARERSTRRTRALSAEQAGEASRAPAVAL